MELDDNERLKGEPAAFHAVSGEDMSKLRVILSERYEQAGLASYYEALPLARKDELIEKFGQLPGEDRMKLKDIAMIGHGKEIGHDLIGHAVMRNIKISPEWIEGFIEKPSEERPEAFKKIVVEAAEQAQKNSIDVSKAATYLAIGGTAGYFAAAGIAAASMGPGGLALLTYGVTKGVIHYGSNALFEKAADSAFEAMTDRLDKSGVPDNYRKVATMALCASKIMTMKYGENAVEATLDLAHVEKAKLFSELFKETFKGQSIKPSDAEVGAMAESMCKVDKNVFAKIYKGEKLDSSDFLNLGEAKEIGKKAFESKSDIVQAFWSGTRREAKQRTDSLLMLHAVNGNLSTVASDIKSQYIGAGLTPEDQELRRVKMDRLAARAPAIGAAGLPRGEGYLTLAMDDKAFSQYLDSGVVGRTKLLAKFPPDPGETRAAAMTPWEDLDAPKGGPLALKLSTTVKAAQAYATVKTLGGLAISAASAKLSAADAWAENAAEKADAWVSTKINEIATDAIHGVKAGLTSVADMAKTGVGFLSKLEQRRMNNAANRQEPEMKEHAAKKHAV